MVMTTHPTDRVAVHSIARKTTNKTTNVTFPVKFEPRNTFKSSVLGFNIREPRMHKCYNVPTKER
jgi:hypothetical protein